MDFVMVLMEMEKDKGRILVKWRDREVGEVEGDWWY